MNKKGMLFSRNTQNNYNLYDNCVNSTKNIALKSDRRSYEEGIIKTYIRLLQISELVTMDSTNKTNIFKNNIMKSFLMIVSVLQRFYTEVRLV